jgi:hypothetical protein
MSETLKPAPPSSPTPLPLKERGEKPVPAPLSPVGGEGHTVPKSGYRSDGSAVYRKENEFLIVRSDQYSVEKIVTYGITEE